MKIVEAGFLRVFLGDEVAHRSRALVSHSIVLGSIPTNDGPDNNHKWTHKIYRCKKVAKACY